MSFRDIPTVRRVAIAWIATDIVWGIVFFFALRRHLRDRRALLPALSADGPER